MFVSVLCVVGQNVLGSRILLVVDSSGWMHSSFIHKMGNGKKWEMWQLQAV